MVPDWTLWVQMDASELYCTAWGQPVGSLAYYSEEQIPVKRSGTTRVALGYLA